jgi:hypothetical protein
MHGQTIISLAESLLQKLAENDSIIIEKRISNSTLENIVKELMPALTSLKAEVELPTPAEERLQKTSGALGMIINSLSSSLRASQDELIKLEATQDGMRRALTTVKDVGQNMININKNDDERIEEP